MIKTHLTRHTHFFFFATVATLALVSLSLFGTPPADSARTLVYQFSILGYFGFLVVLIGLISLPLSFFYVTRWILPLFLWVWMLYLLIDYYVFDLYGFHVNLLILEMFFLDFKGMGIPVFLLGLVGVVAVFILAFSFLLMRWSYFPSHQQVRLGWVVLVMMLPLFMVQSMISIWGHRYNREEITQYSGYFPLFYPVTSSSNGEKLAEYFSGIFPPVFGEARANGETKTGIVRYPLEPLLCENENPQSILMIVLESWQADALRQNVMPNLWSFTQTASHYKHHLSSGTSTVPGLFGLMFGIHPTYHDLFKTVSHSNPTVLTETISGQGYRSKVFTSGSLERFALRTLFFPRVSDGDYYEDRADRDLVDRLVKDLRDPVRSNQPNFDFVFLSSSHSPYYYPEEFSHFKPLPKVQGGYALNKMAENMPYKNHYLNSVKYLDSLLGEIISALNEAGSLDKTWIIITGDHAEEFNENNLGYWGHGSNFSRWQTHVPLVVRVPGQRVGASVDRTSTHQDVVPTLMRSVLGCNGASSAYSNGESLFALPDSRSTVLSSYFVHAYWVDGVVYERTRPLKYAWDDMGDVDGLQHSKEIRQLMEQERQFIR